MEIKSYIDSKTKEQLWRFRVIKRSTLNRGLRVDWIRKGYQSKAEAQKAYKKVEREAERTLFEKEQEGLVWKNLIEQWELAAKSDDVFIRKITNATVNDYVAVITKFTQDWMNTPVDEIDKSMAWRLLDRVDREVSINRRKRLRTAIDAVYNWGFLSGKITGTKNLPTEGFCTIKKEDDKLPEILSISEIKTFLKTAETVNNLWYPIWSLALLTGMRSGELFALTWRSVDFDSEIIYVHENWTSKEGIGPTKGRYWRSVPMSDELKVFLKELKLKSRGGYKEQVWRWKSNSNREKENYTEKEFVLPHFQAWKCGRQSEVIRSFLIGIGLPSVRFHTLRSCFATQLIKDGVAPAVVMKICGWCDLKTMQRYIRLAGVEVKGATNSLRILPEKDAMGRVVELFKE